MDRKTGGVNSKEGDRGRLPTSDSFRRESEIPRQLVHMSGLAFITLAFFIDKMSVGMLFMLAALFFLLYSEYVSRCGKDHRTVLSRLECRLRDFALMFERRDAKKPFAGAFWFYFGAGLAFLLFPLYSASAAAAILAVSDSLSTIIGKRFGRHPVLGKKTLEGTAAFFASAFLVCTLFLNPFVGVTGAIAATFAELIPEWRRISSSRLSGLLDDNLLIPIVAGLVLTIVIL
jgi:dolichol kinase